MQRINKKNKNKRGKILATIRGNVLLHILVHGLLDSLAKMNLTPAESVSFTCIAPALRETCVFCKSIKISHFG